MLYVLRAFLSSNRNAPMLSADMFGLLYKSSLIVRFIRSTPPFFCGLLGEVDEKTNPVPQPGDLYGCAKLRAEQTLIQLSAHTKTPLRICRIGSVFSVMTPRKIPTPLRKLSRWVDKGMNTHLISARNVAQAIYYIANHPDPNPGETYNITQEIEGENDYMKLGDLLHGVQKPHSAYKTYMPVNWIRNLYKHFHGTSIAMPYITVKESKLSNEKFQYHTDLLTSLQKSKEAIERELPET